MRHRLGCTTAKLCFNITERKKCISFLDNGDPTVTYGTWDISIIPFSNCGLPARLGCAIQNIVAKDPNMLTKHEEP